MAKENKNEKSPIHMKDQLEIKRLQCINLKLRMGMLQVGMESMQKDFITMNQKLSSYQEEFGPLYTELKELMKCPEGQEINLETGEFVTPQQQSSN